MQAASQRALTPISHNNFSLRRNYIKTGIATHCGSCFFCAPRSGQSVKKDESISGNVSCFHRNSYICTRKTYPWRAFTGCTKQKTPPRRIFTGCTKQEIPPRRIFTGCTKQKTPPRRTFTSCTKQKTPPRQFFTSCNRKNNFLN